MTQDVERGWIILDSRQRPWDRCVYPTAEAAEATAKACLTSSWSVRPGRWVTHFRPSGRGLQSDIKVELIVDP